VSSLPTGTVTFLFTDIEGSTRLVQRLGEQAPEMFALHGDVMRRAMDEAGGTVIRTEGDSFFVVFASAPGAVTAAVAAQRGLAAVNWPHGLEVAVRMGMHTGVGALGGDDYVGIDVHRAARIAAAAHGGQIVVSAATKAVAGDLDGIEYRDLGEHRLKDLDQPERVYQVTADGLRRDFPALTSLSAIPNNLPTELTSFIPRPEVATAGALLDDHRLLTLTGPGGTGKSRLALQIARTRSDRYDGVYYVPLAAVTDPSLVAMTIASTIGLSHTAEDPQARLGEYLKTRHFLLVLDNFEQILAAAPVVARLLADAPDLSIIVTSRAGLHVSGEQEFPVPPLAVPNGKRDLESLRSIGAVALFIERAMAARPEFALDTTNAGAVAEITRRLDGLPLAIELAAARVRLLPPQTMLERLGGALDLLESNRRDLPDRQRTLRGAISWSYDLLDDDERRLVRLVSVFRGGATLETIEDVCARVSGASKELLGRLESLVDHSLIRTTERSGSLRFGMLETIREFMWEELRASEECGDVETAHLRAFTDLAERVSPNLTTAAQVSALEELDAERDNLRAALTYAVDSGQATEAYRLVAAMWRYWHMRGLIPEGRARVAAVVRLPMEDAALRSGALEAAGGLAYWANDMGTAADLYTQALEAAREAGDDRRIGFAHYNLAFPVLMRDAESMNVDAGTAHLDAADEIFTRRGDRLGLASVAWGRSLVAMGLEDFQLVVDKALEANAMFEDEGDAFMGAWAKHNAEIAYIRMGDFAKALPLAEICLDRFEAAGDVSGITLTLGNVTHMALGVGLDEDGLRMWGVADALAARTGVNLFRVVGTFIGLTVEAAEARVSPEDLKRWMDVGNVDVDEALKMARALVEEIKERLADG
jgi:predicted ATPase/class 3 adenylate cyclase